MRPPDVLDDVLSEPAPIGPTGQQTRAASALAAERCLSAGFDAGKHDIGNSKIDKKYIDGMDVEARDFQVRACPSFAATFCAPLNFAPS